jgi:hypothetical protein
LDFLCFLTQPLAITAQKPTNNDSIVLAERQTDIPEPCVKLAFHGKHQIWMKVSSEGGKHSRREGRVGGVNRAVQSVRSDD